MTAVPGRTPGGPETTDATPPDDTAQPDDDALAALEDLVREIDRCATELQLARERAELLLTRRRTGSAWHDIVSAEARPLVVERISTVLSGLAGAGSAWRKAQAHALQDEQVSINRIATLYGVTRQRISALLREERAARR